jgi:hypothetical protein
VPVFFLASLGLKSVLLWIAQLSKFTTGLLQS